MAASAVATRRDAGHELDARCDKFVCGISAFKKGGHSVVDVSVYTNISIYHNPGIVEKGDGVIVVVVVVVVVAAVAVVAAVVVVVVAVVAAAVAPWHDHKDNRHDGMHRRRRWWRREGPPT